MTVLQDLFNESLNHIRTQGGASLDHYGHCVYQAPDGRSCAAAPFILNYSKDMEDSDWDGLVDCDWWVHECLDPRAVANSDFVMRLQDAHDTAAAWARTDGSRDFMQQYEGHMRDLAAEHGLDYEEVGA